MADEELFEFREEFIGFRHTQSDCLRHGSAQPTDALPADYTVHQGFREESNVTVVEELVDLITVTRLYEANLQSIRSMDDRWKQVLDVAMK